MVARVMILAGGTGGHIFPALAVAEELRAQGCELHWMGTRAGLEARLVPQAGIAIDWLAVAGFRGKGLRPKLLAPFKLLLACWQAGGILRRFRPDVVLGMGGFVAGPGGLMARLLGIPLVIHEQNRIPGTTNRLLVKCARHVLEAFPGSFAPQAGAVCVGNPLRRAIADAAGQDKPANPGTAFKLLVIGGSLGAKVLNETVPAALALVGGALSVRHQTGAAMQAETAERYLHLGIDAQVSAFIEDMAEAYQWADMVVCRAGAMTVSELAAVGLPALLVPYPHAIDDHQTANARFFAQAGAAVLLAQSELTPHTLSEALKALIHNPERLAAMSATARGLAKPDAAGRVAEICLRGAGA
ncbi:MAG: undecaprenyldiphospho-muramoylpentapeptide beta-N-acetylglucosaminyltransferase [Candidatus Methylumidiphilus sp.]